MAFRLEKLDTLRQAGVDPYPVKSIITLVKASNQIMMN